MITLLKFVQKKTQLQESSVKNTIQLLNDDCTIPFIARYRKERTGDLDEVQIELIVKYKDEFEILDKRKKPLLKYFKNKKYLAMSFRKKLIAAII